MRFYKYKGTDSSGSPKTGFAMGKNKAEAVSTIRDMQSIDSVKIHSIILRETNLLDKKKVALMFDQLAYLLDAGIPLHRALATLKESGDANIQWTASKLYSSISEGKSLSQAVKALGYASTDRFVAQLEAGEKAATLETVMKKISEQLKKELENRSSIVTVMIYPIFTLIFSLGSALYLLINIVPQIAEILYEMGGTLPYLTKVMLDISDVLVKYGVFIMFGVTLAIFAFVKYIHGAGRLWWSRVILKVPVVSDIIMNQQQINFYRSLHYMIDAGISLVPALKNSYATVGHEQLKRDLESATARVQDEGINLANAMQSIEYLNPLRIQAIRVGIESNRLSETLVTVSDELERSNEVAVERFKSMLNPVLMIMVGAVCGVIIVAMYLPMFSVMGNI